MGIQRYMFFSIYNCEKYPEVPLMNIKSCTEKFLQASGLNQTTFRLCGFHQVGDICSDIITDFQYYVRPLITLSRCFVFHVFMFHTFILNIIIGLAIESADCI